MNHLEHLSHRVSVESINYQEWADNFEGDLVPAPIRPVFNGAYNSDYDTIAFEAIKETGVLANVCVALKRTQGTIRRWISENPTFASAVEAGKLEAEVVFRKKLADAAYSPSSEVNTTLLKLIAKNVHDIGDDNKPTVVINNKNTVGTEDETSVLYAEALAEIE